MVRIGEHATGNSRVGFKVPPSKDTQEALVWQPYLCTTVLNEPDTSEEKRQLTQCPQLENAPTTAFLTGLGAGELPPLRSG